MLNRIFLLLSLTILNQATLRAQAPKYSNEFLAIGVGAKALAMSGAYCGLTDDVTSGYWNPAGLAHVHKNLQLTAMHNEYFAGIAKFDYGAMATPIGASRAIGISIMRFAVDDIINSTELIDKDNNIDYDKLKTFSAADYGVLLSYAQEMKKTGLSVGGNVKIIHRKAGEFAKAWGFGIDLGLQYENGPWHFGAVGKDITSTFNAWTYNTESLKEVFAQTGNEIPENGLEITLPRLITGVGYKTNLAKKISMNAELDLDMTFDGKRNVLIKSDPVSIDPKLGAEIGYDDIVFLRMGLGNVQEVKNIDQSTSTIVQPNFGVGLKLGNFTLDYAFTNFIPNASELYSHVFSLKLTVVKKTTTSVGTK